MKEFTLYRCQEFGHFGKFEFEHPCVKNNGCHPCPYDQGFLPNDDNVITLKIQVEDGEVVSAELLPPKKID